MERRKAKVPIEGKEQILKDLNHDYKEKLVEFAQYFANARRAEIGIIADLDVEGLDLTYFEATENGFGLQERQVRIAWNKQLSSNADLFKEMKLLYSEVSMVKKMNETVDKTYIPPGRDKKVALFVSPVWEEYLFVTIYWSLMALLCQPYLLPPQLRNLIILVLGSYDAVYNILFAVVCVNSALSLAVLYICLSAEFPLFIALKWAGLTLCFGFMTAGPAIKLAFKRKNQMEAEDEIG